MTLTSPRRLAIAAAALALLHAAGSTIRAQVPHGQDRPPGPALSPAEALGKMTVPDGFRVELFASEPDIVNPVTMCFDAKGRIWIAESLEYPRREPGPGQDRIKVLEDTDSDGKADRFTVFADGLNIPCGIAIGHGGVFVTNSPDILFLEDTDGDGKADRREVVLTGFGRSDTHELPNTLTWGPDGWLYGLNGVFNPARVMNKGKEHRFDAALWRYHPRTRDFELFAQGTSNPWGLAFDATGSAFVSACVIDHLYHLAETGYYHRQAGAYPPFTWKIESVVEHRHQKAAYCGLAIYDADVYPEEYRGRIFMGNIHGNCINADRLERRGATYLAEPEKDFLGANDAWFMPVCIRLGPDGCFYVLDWYDRYHCYQDANRDPKGIDRLKGRLYRIAYGKAPPAGRIDVAAETTEKLAARLASPNLWWRSEAQRILSERIATGADRGAAASLEALVLDEKAPAKSRAHALWALVSADDPGAEPKVLRPELHLRILSLADAALRAWGVRAAGNLRKVDASVRARVMELADDPSADVRLQVAVAARKLLEGEEAASLLLATLAASEGDALIPRIVWRNMEPLLESRGEALAARLAAAGEAGLRPVEPIIGRIVERLLARKEGDPASAAALVAAVLAAPGKASRPAGRALEALAEAAVHRAIPDESLPAIQAKLAEPIGRILETGRDEALYFPALAIAAAWREPAAVAAAREILLDPKADEGARGRALDALLASRDPSVLEAASRVLEGPGAATEDFARSVILGLGRLDGAQVASVLLGSLGKMAPSLRPQALDVLTGRPEWAAALLDAVDSKSLDRSALNVNQVRKILALADGKLKERVVSTWGHVRTDRNPDRERVIQRVRRALEARPGDPWSGRAVYDKTCAQCHVLFGRGTAVGPDITVNGRETVEALLSNLLDPNLVIGKGYESWTCVTTDGRALNGLLVEDSPERAVIKVAGGKDEIIPRAEIASLSMSEVSLMPEDLEKTLTEDELRGLIAYLRYEEAPPEPVETGRASAAGGEKRIAVEQTYGEAVVSARFPDGGEKEGAAGPLVELLRYRHSNDQRPYVHPVRAPGLETVLTALRPDDHPWQYGVFTGHARVNGLDFWHEKGWIRSRGLASVREETDRVEIVARSDWLTERRAGKRVLIEEQRITVHAPRSNDRYRIDFEWRLTPDEKVTFGRYDYGGLAFRPADHEDRKHARAAGESGHAWQDVSGLFGKGDGSVAAGAAILDHPGNPGYPNAWRVDGQGLINPAITARGPIEIEAGKTAAFRWRIVVHLGHGDPKMLDEELREWAGKGP
jgi:putative membrane-bound dehydrogenase-like protein